MCEWHDWTDLSFCRWSQKWVLERNRTTVQRTEKAWNAIQIACKGKALGCLKNLFTRNDPCERMHPKSKKLMSYDVPAQHSKTLWLIVGVNKKDVLANRWIEKV